jgi:hypothetical protein
VSTVLTILLLVPLAAGTAAAAWAVLQRRRIARDEAFQALAARRGWSLTISDQKLGRPPSLRLAARSGPGWIARATRAGHGDSHSVQAGTEFEIDEPRWPDGLFVIGPAPVPAPDAAALQTPEGQRALARTLGDDVAKYAAVLRHAPLDGGLALYATADLPPRFDIPAIGRRMSEWKGTGSSRPILILGPEGMRLRLRHDTTRADRMEGFIDLALDLARTI